MEGRILLALDAYRKGQYRPKAALAFDVHELQHALIHLQIVENYQK